MDHIKTPLSSPVYSPVSRASESFLFLDSRVSEIPTLDMPYKQPPNYNLSPYPTPPSTEARSMDVDDDMLANDAIPKYIPGVNQPNLSPEYQAGAVIERRYDPNFTPPPLYPEVTQYELENTYYYDLIHEIALQHQWLRKCNRDLGTARRLLAVRISERLYPVLLAIPEEVVRQQTIFLYIANHLHDVYAAQDVQLRTLVNNYFNTMVGKGLPAELAARDVHF
ncbi:hypothetical protein BJV82DRAFT_711309 [Fennellomyces sp. T-0311]|nr:hypothetical protein BJV82DRAFT_711309 [Fennellomyces sp. T-0311]